MTSNTNRKRLIMNIIAAGVMVNAILLLFSIFSNAVSTAPYPNEYREAANIYMTKNIVEGNNIYSPNVLYSDEPGFVYLYGPLESIVASVFVLLFRADIPMVHYVLAYIFMVAGAVLMARIAYEHTSTYFAPAMAFLCTIYCNWRYGYIYAAPDAMGLFLMILFLFVLTRKDFRFQPMIAAIIAILSFFTKQYFAVIALTGFIYLLFVKKKDALRYALSGVLFSVITFIVITIRYPLYWTYSLYFLKGSGAGAPSTDIAGTAHNISQVKYIGALFFFFFLFSFVHIVETVYRIIKKEITINVVTSDKNKPLFMVEGDEHFNIELLFYIQMLVAAFILYYIGNNAGAFISYYLQLFVPPLVIISVIATDNIRIKNTFFEKYGSHILVAGCILMSIYTILRAQPRLIVTKMADIDREYWTSFYETIAEYDHGEVYYNPLGLYPVVDTDKYIYNTGMPFVISEKFLDKYNNSELSQRLFPYAGKIMQQHLDYRNTIRKNVLDGKYEMIIYMDDMDTVFSRDDMAGRYYRRLEMPIKAGSWSWDVCIYTLKADDSLDELIEQIENIDY